MTGKVPEFRSHYSGTYPEATPEPEPDLQERYAEEILRVAAAQVGKKELPGNRGPYVARMLRHVGIGEPAPWCTAVACWILQEAARNIGAQGDTCPDFASGSKLWRWARKHPDLCTLIREPADLLAGDVVIQGSTFDKARRIRRGGLASGHTWIARTRSLNYLGYHGSYEGNTNTKGSREGDGFKARHRSMSDPRTVGAIRFRALEPRA